MFSFLYRVFYDRTLFSLYISKGKGFGIKPLVVLALFTSLCLTGRIFLLFCSVSPRMINEFIAQVPEIVFEKGVITAPEKYHYSYVSKNGNIFFVFDTTGSLINLKDLPSTGLYITADAIVTVRRNEVRRVPFINILKKGDFILSQTDVRDAVKEVFSLSKILVPPVVLILYFPLFFGAFFFMSVFCLVFSFLMTELLKMKLTWGERLRLTALSVMPAGVINGLGVLLNIGFLFELLSLIVILVYMFCFLKDGQAVRGKA